MVLIQSTLQSISTENSPIMALYISAVNLTRILRCWRRLWWRRCSKEWWCWWLRWVWIISQNNGQRQRQELLGHYLLPILSHPFDRLRHHNRCHHHHYHQSDHLYHHYHHYQSIERTNKRMAIVIEDKQMCRWPVERFWVTSDSLCSNETTSSWSILGRIEGLKS